MGSECSWATLADRLGTSIKDTSQGSLSQSYKLGQGDRTVHLQTSSHPVCQNTTFPSGLLWLPTTNTCMNSSSNAKNGYWLVLFKSLTHYNLATNIATVHLKGAMLIFLCMSTSPWQDTAAHALRIGSIFHPFRRFTLLKGPTTVKLCWSYHNLRCCLNDGLPHCGFKVQGSVLTGQYPCIACLTADVAG